MKFNFSSMTCVFKINCLAIFVCLIIFSQVSCAQTQPIKPGFEVYGNGDTLIIDCIVDADTVYFMMYQGINLTMNKVKAHRFTGIVFIPNLQNGVFSYEISAYKKDTFGESKKIEWGIKPPNGKFFLWTGSNRHLPYAPTDSLKGTIRINTVESIHLKEQRKLTLYLPREFNESTPIIYMTDGQSVSAYGKYVDELIDAGFIEPVILVGIHSSSTNRYKEYVEGGDDVIFQAHQKFFYEEVMKDVEKEIGLKNARRFIYGYSNGAAFCMHAGLNHPELFKEVIAFSTADYISEFIGPIDFKYEQYPRFHMGAGRFEEHILEDNLKFVQKMKANKIDVDFMEFVSGHDFNVWVYEFMEYLRSAFPR